MTFRFQSDFIGSCILELGITDAAKEGTNLSIELNNIPQEFSFEGGYGLKKQNPDQLCEPKTKKLMFNTGLRCGENTLKIKPLSDGSPGMLCW